MRLVPVCAVLVPLVLAGCHAAARPQITYSRDDAERLIRAAMQKQEPTLVIDEVKVSRVWTNAPGVQPGRPFYPVIIRGVRVKGPVREMYNAGWLVDAATGEVFQPKAVLHHSPGASQSPARR